VHLGLLLLTRTGRMESVLIALLVSVLVTCFEALSLGGADNILIPFGTLFILNNVSRLPIHSLLFRLCSIAIIFLITYVIGNKAKRLGSSGIIGMSLVGYGAWILVNPNWYIPVFICTILVSYFDLFLEMPGNQDEFVRVRPIFYMFIGSLFWMIAANHNLEKESLFFVPYVVSFAAILSIRWKWYQREGNLISGRKRKIVPAWVVNGNYLVRAFCLSLAFLVINFFLEVRLDPIFSVISCMTGIMLSDLLYWGMGSRYHGKWTKVGFLRMGFISTMFASVAVFVANLWFY
jgi:phytol kinase